MKKLIPSALLFVATAYLTPFPVKAVEAGDFRWHGKLKPGDTIELKGVNGAIVAQGVSSGDVEVTARKSARKSDPNSVQIKVVEHAGGVTICAVYPDVNGQQNECKPGSGGRMNTRDNDTNVEFTARVPAGVRFAGRSVNGNVEGKSLNSDVEATTVNGNVRVQTSGTVTVAKTVNGSINADAGAANWTRAAEFSSVNGSVAVALPANASADVHGSTVNGSVQSDFPLQVSGKFVGRNINGKLGNGGPELKLSTVNGSITLKHSGV